MARGNLVAATTTVAQRVDGWGRERPEEGGDLSDRRRYAKVGGPGDEAAFEHGLTEQV